MSRENVLKVENVTMQFGGVVAVDNMNLEVDKGEIVSLIGPNGAGKTTAFNVITGVYAPTNGAVYFKGNKIIQNHPQGKMKKGSRSMFSRQPLMVPMLAWREAPSERTR